MYSLTGLGKNRRSSLHAMPLDSREWSVKCEVWNGAVKSEIYTEGLKKEFVLILYIWSQISKNVGTENLLAVLLICYEIRENWYSESYTVLMGIGEIISVFSTFLFQFLVKLCILDQQVIL